MSGVGCEGEIGRELDYQRAVVRSDGQRENAGTEANSRRGEQLNVERGRGGDADGIEQDLHAQMRIEARGAQRDDGSAAERRVGRLNVFGRDAQGGSGFVPAGGEADLLIRARRW